ncbi:bromodomain-containing protein 9-like [Cajanus cajan]|uniref:bromodomain-containing protein 9-like n=1 Tax=Cajanus cajan TaxID=3821 RepID=UPI00098DA79F|nr:bromodomain-containing protein 9-like [Cajanus cajan]
MGSRKKRITFEDETERTGRRRSSRIVALEEKKKQERERKLAQALENDVRNNGKHKATMELRDDDMSDSNNNDDEEGPTKKRHKSKELNQLISSIKALERQFQNANTSGTNVSSLNGMPLKQILEMIIDFLQRKDLHELFAKPVNQKVEHHNEIVQQTMDFGTMRAKLHEGMYTDLEQFKRDVFLICSNAMNANPENSKYHQVAEDISKYAKWIFEALSADPEHFELEFSLNKKRSGRKPQSGQRRTSQKVSSKPAGRNKSSSVTVPETEKRDTYCPPSKPLVSELKKNATTYKESPLRIVEDTGPTAENIAAKQIEEYQRQIELLKNDTLNAQTLALSPCKIFLDLCC